MDQGGIAMWWTRFKLWLHHMRTGHHTHVSWDKRGRAVLVGCLTCDVVWGEEPKSKRWKDRP